NTMNTYIAILRGINVSGQKIIKMDALRQLFENSGFSNVRTYIQSGNVLFSSEQTNTSELEQLIATQIEKEFGFQVPVLILTHLELQQIVENNPFLNDETKNPAFLHITFLASTPVEDAIDQLTIKKAEQEAFLLTQNALYLYCPNGYGNTKLTNNFIESKLKVQATTRNWKTTLELLKMAEK
ncbi:MAG TPA: DUF1697 domain-containing protein, partial [Taishania sp.]|nr:DUF1697 domain-containing protein [Taishania sp.]